MSDDKKTEEKKNEEKPKGGGGGTKISPFAIPILIILFAAAIAFGASMMFEQRQSIEWTFQLFMKVAIPALLIAWAAKGISKP